MMNNQEKLPRQLSLNYLAGHQVMTLATRGPEGLWAAAVFYANLDFELYFLSAGHTRHAKNITAEPRVAATIQEDYKDWPAIQGIQMEGVVRLLQGTERDEAIAHYTVKYPFIAQADEQIQRGLARVNWYCLRPDLFYLIDNSKGLGHRDQIML
jgi:uncharacterized protein YhbP (UPF0306 family)